MTSVVSFHLGLQIKNSVILCARVGHSVAHAHHWCILHKLPVKNDILVVYMHIRLNLVFLKFSEEKRLIST